MHNFQVITIMWNIEKHYTVCIRILNIELYQ
jgi:hypothetical protein